MTIDFQPRLINLMVPHVVTTADRHALITEAFGMDPKAKHVFEAINMEGASRTFCVMLIQTIFNRDCQLFKPLLTTLRYRYGADRQAEADELLSQVDTICAEQQTAVESVKPEINLSKTALRQRMSKKLQKNDLEVIVLELNDLVPQDLDWDNVATSNKNITIVRLLDWLENRGHLDVLINYFSENEDYAHVLSE
ncbi:MAG: hypothetical protein AAF633_05890 [Chloroflexota bacterium]